MNWERIELSRLWGRSLLTIAGLAITVAVFQFIAAPIGPTPMSGPETSRIGIPTSSLMTVMGIGGMLFGLAWMWRIYKAPTQYADGARWRYRDR